jgi:hypothetical protein
MPTPPAVLESIVSQTTQVLDCSSWIFGLVNRVSSHEYICACICTSLYGVSTHTTVNLND